MHTLVNRHEYYYYIGEYIMMLLLLHVIFCWNFTRQKKNSIVLDTPSKRYSRRRENINCVRRTWIKKIKDERKNTTSLEQKKNK